MKWARVLPIFWLELEGTTKPSSARASMCLISSLRARPAQQTPPLVPPSPTHGAGMGWLAGAVTARAASPLPPTGPRAVSPRRRCPNVLLPDGPSSTSAITRPAIAFSGPSRTHLRQVGAGSGRRTDLVLKIHFPIAQLLMGGEGPASRDGRRVRCTAFCSTPTAGSPQVSRSHQLLLLE